MMSFGNHRVEKTGTEVSRQDIPIRHRVIRFSRSSRSSHPFRWWGYIWVMACVAAVVASAGWGRMVAAQGGGTGNENIPDDIVTETRTVALYNGQTATMTCSFNFTRCQWKVETYGHPVSRIVINMADVEFPDGQVPTGWQPVPWHPWGCVFFQTHGAMFHVEFGEGNYMGFGRVWLRSERLIQLTEFQWEAVLPVKEDADGKKPVFPGDPIRLRYAFSRTVPPEANARWRFFTEEFPIHPSGRGEVITRFPFGAIQLYPPGQDSFPYQWDYSINPFSDSTLPPILPPSPNFNTGTLVSPSVVQTSDGPVYFRPMTTYNFGYDPSLPGALHLRPDMIRASDCPPPGPPPPDGPRLEIVPIGGWIGVRIVGASPMDFLVTLNKGAVVSARRLATFMGSNLSAPIAFRDLWFAAGMGPHHVAVLRSESSRPFIGHTLDVTGLVPLRPVAGSMPVNPVEIITHACPEPPPGSPEQTIQLTFDIPSLPESPYSGPLPPVSPPSDSVPPFIMPQRIFDFTEPIEVYAYNPGTTLSYSSLSLEISKITPGLFGSLRATYYPLSFLSAEFHPIPPGQWVRCVYVPGYVPADALMGSTDIFSDVRNPVHQFSLSFPATHLRGVFLSWTNSYGVGSSKALLYLPGLATHLPEEHNVLCSPLRPIGPDGISSFANVRLFFPFGKTAMTIKAGFTNDAFFDAGSHYTILPVHVPTKIWNYSVRYAGVNGLKDGIGVTEFDGKRVRAYVITEVDESQYGVGCATVNIPVSVSPPRVPASQETVVQVTIPAGYQFFYGVIQGGREPVIFERPGTYRVIIPPGVNRRPIRVTFHSSQPNCPVSVTEVLVDREPLAARGWIIAADPGFPDAPPKGGPYGPGVYWEGPSYESGIARLKEISVAYQKKHGMQLPEIPPAPSRKGIALLTENPSTGTRQREW